MSKVLYLEDSNLFSSTADTILDIREVNEDDWRAARKPYIGASESAKVMNLSKYGSAMTVYSDKKGLTEEFKGNIHTKYGTRMEPVIAEWLCDDFPETTGIEIEIFDYPFMLVSKESPCMSGNLDRIAQLKEDYVDPETGLIIKAGEWFPVEIKTASEFLTAMWEGEDVPTEYYVQCQHQMYITNTKYNMLVYLVGKKLGWKFVPRHEEDIVMIKNACVKFNENFLVADVMPSPTGLDTETPIITGQLGLHDGDVFIPEVDNLIEQYIEQSEINKESEKEKRRLSQEIMLLKNGNKKCHGNMRTFNSWEVKRDKLDNKLLRSKYPEVYEEIKTGQSVYVNYRIGKVK